MGAVALAGAGLTDPQLVRWGGLIVFSTLLFGYFVTDSKKLFRSARFWMLFTVLLAAHLGIFAIVLLTAPTWKLTWFSVVIFDTPVLVWYRERCFPEHAGRVTQRMSA